jgi:hypothetical protein
VPQRYCLFPSIHPFSAFVELGLYRCCGRVQEICHEFLGEKRCAKAFPESGLGYKQNKVAWLGAVGCSVRLEI